MISKYSVKKPYTVIVGVVMVLLLGVISFMESTTDLLPEMELPVVVVYTSYPGASAEKVETEVTRPIESAVATTENLINMSSTSSDNLSMIILEFADDTNMDSAMINLNANIDMIESMLPELVGAPNLLALNPNMMPIMMATVDYEGMDIQELSDFVSEEVIPELEKTAGVASVTVTGLLEETIHIMLNQEKIDEINNKILDNVNSELAEAERELKDALDEVNEGLEEIEDAESEMDDAKDEALDGLGEASVQMQQAASNLIAMDAQITQLMAEQMAFKGIVDAYESMEALPQGIDGIITQNESVIADINSLLTDLNNDIDVSAGALPEDTLITEFDTEKYNKLIDTTNNIENSLRPAIPPATVTLPQFNTYKDAIDYLNTNLPYMQSSVDDLKTLQSQYPDAVSKLNTLDVEIATAESVKSTASKILTDNGIDVSDLSKLQTDLESGKITAGSDFAVGEMTLNTSKQQLEDAKAQLEDSLEEMEDAKEDALESANISEMLSGEMIGGILQAENFSMPAGYVDSDDSSILVKVGDVFNSLDELENLLILPLDLDGLSNVYLGDLATIEIANNSDEIYTKVNGNEAVMISFQKTSTSSTSEVTKDIHKNFENLCEEHEGLNYTALMDQGVYIDMIIASVLQNFMFGGILAVLVLILFLKDLKPTIVIGLSIPFSLMFTIVLMYFSDITMNIISLSGLALGVGMLVDNSVVVVENIYRMRGEGVSLIKASIEGAKQVSGAIIASTLTTVCVFLPIVFATGIARQLFVDMGLTIAYSLLASLIVALTLVPMLSSKLLKKQPSQKQGFFNGIISIYEKTLKWALSHRLIILISSGVLFVGSIIATFSMGIIMIPEMASTQLSMTVTMIDEKATLEDTTAVMDEILDELTVIEGVDTAGVSIDANANMLMGGGSSSSATFYIITEENVAYESIEDEILLAVEGKPVESSISSNNMDMSALTGSGVVINVFGNDLDELQEASRLVGEQLSTFDGVKEVNDGLDDPVQELRIVVDKNAAMELGLTVAQVFQSVSDEINTETSSTTLTIDNKDYPVIILKDKDSLIKSDNLDTIVMDGTSDNETIDVELDEIASIENGVGAQSISRDNSRRYMSVSATIEETHNISLVSRDIEENFDDSNLPSGITLEFSGENETIMETMVTLLLMIGLAIVFIYMIMVAQFQSLLSPFIVMFTIPLAFTGGLLALFITGVELSVVSMLGFLVLSGVVVNNGIVFIDYVNQLINDKHELYDALISAGKTRLRPILMTALTTILAMTTMALGIGEGSEMMQGMAIVTIGGLTYATVLTLYVVPIIYSLFHRKKKNKVEIED